MATASKKKPKPKSPAKSPAKASSKASAKATRKTVTRKAVAVGSAKSTARSDGESKPLPADSDAAVKRPASLKKRGNSEPDRSAPALAEVDAEVLEFIAAIDEFKKANGRPFPSWSEVLLVVRQLGYKRS